MTPTCPYCGKSAELTTGAVLYPHLPLLSDKKIWRCWPCEAHVGCHPNTEKPLGRLANRELRKAKMEAHDAFDPLWAGGKRAERLVGRNNGRPRTLPAMTRSQAYSWLAGKLGIEKTACHIGYFDVEMCKRVVEACRDFEQTVQH